MGARYQYVDVFKTVQEKYTVTVKETYTETVTTTTTDEDGNEVTTSEEVEKERFVE